MSEKIYAVKYGGNAMKSPELKKAVMEDIVTLTKAGHKVVLIHGGGPEINKMLQKIGKEAVFIKGLRYTDEETMEVVQSVLAGKVNKDLVALIQVLGGKAMGLCGMDGAMFLCEKKQDDVDYGLVGEVIAVNPEPVLAAWEAGAIPVIATIGMGKDGQAYNINADTAAAALAGALGADRFISMTDVPGLLRDKDDPSTLISQVDLAGVEKLIEEGILAGGMIPKVGACTAALDAGVPQAQIIDGREVHNLLAALAGEEPVGTTFTK
ncbi:MAG: acetylglutamate kinase [Firmicutes bacterium]|nr:acetylglutamate kinase [Bacillota bacterium]